MSSVKQELSGFKADIYNGNLSLESEKIIFANKLMNGMGEEMMNEINHPYKPSKWEIFKVKFKLFVRKFKNAL